MRTLAVALGLALAFATAAIDAAADPSPQTRTQLAIGTSGVTPGYAVKQVATSSGATIAVNAPRPNTLANKQIVMALATIQHRGAGPQPPVRVPATAPTPIGFVKLGPASYPVYAVPGHPGAGQVTIGGRVGYYPANGFPKGFTPAPAH